MFFWFLGLSFALVLIVFSSPALDFRLVMLGSVLPVVDAALGPWILHTLTGAVAALVLVMAITVNQRLLRRQLLGLPIGLFLHLVLDATWTKSTLFWWPFLGTDGVLGVEGTELDRSPALIFALEIVGIVVLVFLVKRLDLRGSGRDKFVTTGQLLRDRLD